MKRQLVYVTMMLCLAAGAGAQSLDMPAATVRLTKTESVTVSQLKKAIAPYETQAKRSLTADERKLVLDRLVTTLLVGQAADRDKVIVSDAEVKQAITDAEKQYGSAANLGRDMTDAELQQFVKTSGATWDEFLKSIKENRLMVDYAIAKRPGLGQSIKAVTDQDAQDYYDSNKASFFQDDMVTLRHIFIDTHLLTNQADRDKAAKLADDISKELKGGAAFSDLVMKYSNDTTSKYKAGDIGLFTRSNAQQRQFYGTDFFDSIFKLKKGDTSGVLKSNLGYHIVQVTNRFDAKLLTLDDKMPPQNQILVKDYIKAMIGVQRQREALAKALDEITTDLKKQAQIQVFDKNIAW